MEWVGEGDIRRAGRNPERIDYESVSIAGRYLTTSGVVESGMDRRSHGWVMSRPAPTTRQWEGE